MSPERPSSARPTILPVSPQLSPLASPRLQLFSPVRNSGNTLSHDEAVSVHAYTSTLQYQRINETLRDRPVPKIAADIAPLDLASTVAAIDSALNKLSHAQGRPFTHTFRAVDHEYTNHLAALERNDVQHDPAFVSTTRATKREVNRLTLNRLAANGALLHLYGRRSADVAKPTVIPDVGEVRLSDHECLEEQLYPRDTYFRTLLNVPVNRADRVAVKRTHDAERRADELRRMNALSPRSRKIYRGTLAEQSARVNNMLRAGTARRVLVFDEVPDASARAVRSWKASDRLTLDRLGIDARLG